MNHFIEGNNQSYNFIAPLGPGLFYIHTDTHTHKHTHTHTHTKNKNNTGVFRFIDLARIV